MCESRRFKLLSRRSKIKACRRRLVSRRCRSESRRQIPKSRRCKFLLRLYISESCCSMCGTRRLKPG